MRRADSRLPCGAPRIAAAPSDQQIDGPCSRMGSVAALFAVLCVVGTSWAQPSLEVVGSWGGPVRGVFVDEAEPDIAYIGSGRRLVVLNIADPANIIELGSVDVGNEFWDVTVRGDYAYVAVHDNPDVCVVDLSDLNNLRVVWTHDDNAYGHHIVRYGDYLYAWGATNDLGVFDISDPATPQFRGRGIDSIVSNLTIVGDLMFMVDNFRHLLIYDLTIDPIHPTELGRVTLPAGYSTGTGIAVEGQYAYATILGTRPGEGTFAIVDVLDPTLPQVVWSKDSLSATDVDVSGDVAYLTEEGGVTILDVSTPTAPVELTRIRTHGYGTAFAQNPFGSAQGVRLVGTRALLRDAGEGLMIFDVSVPSKPVRSGNFHSPWLPRRMSREGDTLYVSDHFNGFSILDVSDENAPQLLGVYQSSEIGGHWGENWGIDVRNGIAHLAAGWGGPEVVDVGDPARPTMIGRIANWPNDQFSSALLIDPDDETTVWVGYHRCLGAYIGTFDASDPRDLFQRDALLLGGVCNVTHDIVCDLDSRVIHAPQEWQIAIVDAPPPPDPLSLRGLWAWPGRADPYGLVLRGDLRYLANPATEPGVGGLYIQNVADPMAPIDLGFFPAEDSIGVAVDENERAYLTGNDASNDGRGSVFVLDVSDPSDPGLLAKAVLLSARSLLVDGSTVYVTTLWQGLVILELSGVPFPGDLNCDGQINAFDIEPFLVALFDPEGYPTRYPDCDINNADTNGDGSIDAFDIEPFLELLFGP